MRFNLLVVAVHPTHIHLSTASRGWCYYGCCHWLGLMGMLSRVVRLRHYDHGIRCSEVVHSLLLFVWIKCSSSNWCVCVELADAQMDDGIAWSIGWVHLSFWRWLSRPNRVLTIISLWFLAFLAFKFMFVLSVLLHVIAELLLFLFECDYFLVLNVSIVSVKVIRWSHATACHSLGLHSALVDCRDLKVWIHIPIAIRHCWLLCLSHSLGLLFRQSLIQLGWIRV